MKFKIGDTIKFKNNHRRPPHPYDDIEGIITATSKEEDYLKDKNVRTNFMYCVTNSYDRFKRAKILLIERSVKK